MNIHQNTALLAALHRRIISAMPGEGDLKAAFIAVADHAARTGDLLTLKRLGISAQSADVLIDLAEGLYSEE